MFLLCATPLSIIRGYTLHQTRYRHSIHHVRSNAMSQHSDIYQNCYCGSAIIAMPSWDVVNGASLQWKLAEGGLSLLVYTIESVWLFVRGKRQNYGTD